MSAMLMKEKKWKFKSHSSLSEEEKNGMCINVHLNSSFRVKSYTGPR